MFWADRCRECSRGSDEPASSATGRATPVPGIAAVHTVCAVMDGGILAFSKYVGNDLSTPHPEFGFAGLKPGDHWGGWVLLRRAVFLQAHEDGVAPRVNLAATLARALKIVPLEVLEKPLRLDAGA